MNDAYPIPDFLRHPVEVPRERPILFSAPMILALLAGTKTQTRRVCKLDYRSAMPDDELRSLLACCPYGKPGDRLWVREAWGACDYFDNTAPRDLPRFAAIKYFADGSIIGATAGYGLIRKARPSIHMPRQFSRILLEITAVRVERLQDISEADAIAEGVNVHPDHHGKPRGSIYSPVQAYRDLWESINGPDAWDANPFVWVVEFRMVKP